MRMVKGPRSSWLAWGAGPFDNYDASDFLSQLVAEEPESRESLIRQAVTDDVAEDYVQAPEASFAIAAAALIVIGTNGQADATPEALNLCRSGGIPTDREARTAAKAALDRILRDGSELPELALDAGLLDEIRREVEELVTFLR